MPWHTMAWEKKGRGGGALSVLTAFFIESPRMVAVLACEGLKSLLPSREEDTASDSEDDS